MLSELEGLGAVKAVIPLELTNTNVKEEKKLYNLLTGFNSRTGGSLDDIDGAVTPTMSQNILSEASSYALDSAITDDQVDPNEVTSSLIPEVPHAFGASHIVVLAVSCLAAFVGLGCITSLIFLSHIFRNYLTSPATAWGLLSRLEKHTAFESNSDDNDNGYFQEKPGLLLDHPPATRAEGDDRSHEHIVWNEKNQLVDTSGECDYFSDDEDEDMGENFHDAQELLVSHEESDAPKILVHEAADPACPPLPSTPYCTPLPSPLHTPIRRPIPMRELTPSVPLTRPAWSLRAADAPALGIASASPVNNSLSPIIGTIFSLPISCEESNMAPPGTFTPTTKELDSEVVERSARRKAYRAPVPELDIAFAMQLRPGLGLGSDPAWLVRFLMAMFGWMTVLLGGNGLRRYPERRMIV